MKQDLIKQFKLPSYIKGKSFADASKLIEGKFKDRNDKASLDTKRELLQRLSNAQEYLKQQPEIQSNTEEQNVMEGGGFANTLFGKGFQEGATTEDIMGTIGSGLNMATTAINFGSNIFGNKENQIDMSGNTQYQNVNKGSEALGGALQGAQAGMVLGPLGAAGGAIVGGVSNLIGAGKKQKAIDKAKTNKLHMNYNQNMNDYSLGGKTNKYDGITLPTNFLDLIPKIPDVSKLNGTSDDLHTGDVTKDYITSDQPIKRKVDNSSNKKPVEGPASRVTTEADSVAQDTGNFLKDNYADILRMSPIAMNALQLSKLERPGQINLDRLGNRYEPQYVDERVLQNTVNNNFNKEYLTESSGGSTGRYASNARAAQLAKTKAISDAYIKADEINRTEDQRGQQFNLNVDRFNIGQSNREQEINDRNEGAYNTEKSKLFGQLGTDIGNVGREEKFKQMVKESGLCYDSKGRYICGSGERVPDDINLDSKTNEKKYGGNINSKGLFTTYLDSIMKK